MPKFRVKVCVTTTEYRERYIEAESESAAEDQAESEDWREWDILYDTEDSEIESIEEVTEL